ncbi:MAG: phenylalanine--tRNA ligase subunit beta [Deltaproteobacteria bacterium]|nr:phenylalanine--tRNA ligase subunit beta [Deltaproteobacteria bacterium]
MRVTLNWLKEFVDVDIPVEDLAERLTMVGLEVENLTHYDAGLGQVVVGHITDILPHPHAENLSLCRVVSGKNTYRVICGARNIRSGDKVPLALEGAVLPGPLRISRTSIKGEYSEGMLCSAAELGLGEDKSGVYILPADMESGLPLAQALELEDYVLEIGLTPNRADCLSVLGIAREAAAILHKKIRYPKIKISEREEDIHEVISVEVRAVDLCPRYAGRIIKDVTVAESPLWLRKRLLAVGIRPVNNIVDVTNYVLMEYGQPLHAFDLERLAGKRIIVDQARNNETFTTLDGVERTLSDNMLMIADGEKNVALAGIMGGINSEITPKTRSVFIESAYFDPISVRRTSRRLNLSTESSYRFERGIDMEGVGAALDRAVSLMAKAGGGKILRGRIDVYSGPERRKPIPIRVGQVNRLLGSDLKKGEIRRLLESIGIKVREAGKDALLATSPSFRGDLGREVDFIEEVARLDGYEKIPVKLPVVSLTTPARIKSQAVTKICRSVLSGLGFYEVINYSFMDKRATKLLKISGTDERNRHVHLLNPLTEEQSVLRTSLIPNLLSTVCSNLNKWNNNLRLFEVGKIFIDQGESRQPVEKTYLTGMCTGLRYPEGVHFTGDEVDFFDIKGGMEAVFQALGISGYSLDQAVESAPYLRKEESARIVLGPKTLGFVGEMDPSVCEGFDVKEKVFMFELSFDDLVEAYKGPKVFKPLPRYPAVMRDMAIIVSEDVPAGRILRVINELGGDLMENVFIFDVYQGRQIERGYKSLALRVIYRSSEKTLEDEEVNAIHQRIVNDILSRFNGRLREQK